MLGNFLLSPRRASREELAHTRCELVHVVPVQSSVSAVVAPFPAPLSTTAGPGSRARRPGARGNRWLRLHDTVTRGRLPQIFPSARDSFALTIRDRLH
jgi:hypothetical protein